MRKVYYNSLAARLLLWRKGYETAMIFGFICTKRKRAQPLSSKSVNHEAIHVEQYMEVTDFEGIQRRAAETLGDSGGGCGLLRLHV